MKSFFSFFRNIDWLLFGSVFLIVCAGLVTMNSFVPAQAGIEKSAFFDHQIIWLGISLIVFFLASHVDWRFLQNTRILIVLYSIIVFLLLLLFVLGKVSKGAQSWFSFGLFSFQPVDFSKLIIILILAKYFSRRHVEIADIRHIIVSGVYIFVVAVLVLLQPDFGSVIIIFLLWLGMVLISGISKKHLLLVFTVALVSFLFLWGLVFHPYQKERILNFIHPLTNIRGSGYNAYQSTIAVGSGELLGKGVGQGTQSRLQYLPEYQTDFIFAAFAEEWGFIGVLLLFILFSIMFTRLLRIASRAGSNFEMLFGLGLAILFMIHTGINIGMNIGLLPVTGNTLPFMSYGGSHLVAEFLGLGMMMGMSKYNRAVHKEKAHGEIVGM